MGAAELAAFEERLAANLDRCLSCAACTGRCPVEVDIPELKSRFLARYHETRSRPLAHRVLSRFEDLAMAAARTGAPIGPLAGPAGRLLGLVDLPAPARRRLGDLPRFDPSSSAGRPSDSSPDVVVLPDVFNAALDPAVERAAVGALDRLGYRVAVGPFVASAKFDHVKGRRQRFARAAEAQERLVRAVLAAGAVPVIVEPAVGLLHHHEYPGIRPGFPRAVRHLVELLDERRDRLAADAPPGGGERPVTLLSHCTERATAPELPVAWVRVLAAAGYTVSAPPVGCCGMAGIFGHEAGNQGLSRALWDRTWAAHVDRPGRGSTDPVVATGFSCRSQAERFGGRRLAHPVELLGSG